MTEWLEWLENNKSFSNKAARDVISRLKRVQHLIGEESIPKDAILRLATSKEFNQLSMCIKSQLRRAVRLYFEFKENA